jgi:hypothetical protein
MIPPWTILRAPRVRNGYEWRAGVVAVVLCAAGELRGIEVLEIKVCIGRLVLHNEAVLVDGI